MGKTFKDRDVEWKWNEEAEVKYSGDCFVHLKGNENKKVDWWSVSRFKKTSLRAYKKLFWKKERAKSRDLLRHEIEPDPIRPRNSIKWECS